MEQTIELNGAEIAVTELHGAHAHFRNDGADTIYASKNPGIIRGAKGVLSVHAGTSATLQGISGTVYLSGTGSVMLVTSDYVKSPFDTSAQGGSVADKVTGAALNAHAGNADIHVTADEKTAWNNKPDMSDIPTSLPANGGDADTLDGKHADNIFSSAAVTLSDALDLSVSPGLYRTDLSTVNIPVENEFGFVLRCPYGGDGGIAMWFSMTNYGFYVNKWVNGEWSGWSDPAAISNYCRTLNADGLSHGNVWLMTAQHNRAGDGMFRIFCGDGSVGTSVDYAGNSDMVDGRHADEFVLRSDFDLLAARVAELGGK